MMIQLEEMIAVETPLGWGYAVIVESGEQESWWTVILHNGAIVTFTQDRITASRDYARRRLLDDDMMEDIINAKS